METCSSLETIVTGKIFLQTSNKKQLFSKQTHNMFGLFSFTQNLPVEMVNKGQSHELQRFCQAKEKEGDYINQQISHSGVLLQVERFSSDQCIRVKVSDFICLFFASQNNNAYFHMVTSLLDINTVSLLSTRGFLNWCRGFSI